MKKFLPVFLLIMASAVNGAVFTVINNNDAGLGSLRQAILDLNATPGQHVILFAFPGTITLTSGNLPAITKDIAVNGNAGGTIISGNNLYSIFTIAGTGPAHRKALFNGLELKNAYSSATVNSDGGSAIHADYMDTLLINNCYIHDCRFEVNASAFFVSGHGGAVSVTGGGICNTTSVFYLRHSTLSYNILSVTNATGNSEAYGGGLYTISLNDTIVNSTFYGNKVLSTSNATAGTATATGGGMAYYGCSMIMNHATFVADTAKAVNTAGGTAISGAGGLSTVKYSFRISNSLFDLNIANNSPDVGSLGGAVTEVISDGNNAIGTIPASWPSKKITDTINAPMGVLPLAANGFFIPTCAIAPNSPAHDKVVIGVTVLVDQREFSRDMTPDAGAFELEGVLAVSTLSFSAAFCQQNVCLQWNTSNEDNTQKFEVQRSNNGTHFTTINDLPAMGTGANRYTATDIKPMKGINLYRIKTIDRDGSFAFSSVQKMIVADKRELNFGPNPASNFFTLKNNDAIKSIRLLATDGRMIRQWLPLANGRYDFGLLPAGIYLLKVETSNGITTGKLMVQ
ncbi:MAG: T9SS type A sorting domain-containing protein [Bacteroidota bacterium]